MRRFLPIAVLFFLGFLRGSGQSAPNLPYTTAPAFEFDVAEPVAMVSPPGETNRVFLVEKAGRIIVVDLDHPAHTVFLDISGRLTHSGREQGLLALAFHPNYRQNGQFFVWYTGGGEDRLARYQVSPGDPNRADPNSELLLIAQPDEAPNHNGGQLLFGSDGYLYGSIGDEGAANDQFQNSQRVDKDFFSSIWRIDVDKRPGSRAPNPHPASRTGTYTIPPDNPFVGARSFNGQPVDPAKVRTEFWAVGMRNPWRMAFDSATGALWVGDVGQNAYEEIDIVMKGGNYGWNHREGLHAGPRGNPPAEARFIDPIWEYAHSDTGTCITGGFVYHGDRYPDLNGKYLFADYDRSQVWALTPNANPSQKVDAGNVKQIARALNVSSFGLNPRTGEILLAAHTSNKILKLVPAARN